MGSEKLKETNNKLNVLISNPYLLLLPLLGILIFIILYVLSAIKYPGGSYAIPDTPGFSFWHNYLCDLLDTQAINGEENGGRHYARLALGVLCASLLWLWLFLPGLFNNNKPLHNLMKLAGILAFGSMVFLGSQTHDFVVRIAGIFGLVALLICVRELYKARFLYLAALGAISLLVFLLNYYIYETGILIFRLPVIQKFTFILFLSWFALLNLVLYKKISRENS